MKSEPTYYRKLPECDGCGNTQADCINFIRGGSIKCCPDCKHEVPVEPDYEAAEKALSRGEPSFVIVNDAMGIGGDDETT